MESHEPFEHAPTFEQGEVAGGVRLGRFDAHYEELFAEVIEDGIITAEERARLDKAADALGLDKERLRRLEQALQASFEARHSVVVHELPASLTDESYPSLSPIAPIEGAGSAALQRRIAFLEARVAELELALEEARENVAVEVDIGDLGPAAAAGDDLQDLLRRLRLEPRDHEVLRAIHRVSEGDADRRWCAAHALVYLGAANAEERASYQAHHDGGLIQPSSSLTPEAWRSLLYHPDQEVLTGDIFAVVISAVLLGRVAALRHAKALPALDPERRIDPRTSTVAAARCFGWAAAILGMPIPPVYADPSHPGLADVVLGVPPSSRLGKAALSGRSPAELAFVAGRHLAHYREELFVRVLLPSIPDLEDIFLAALTIANPGLPLHAGVKRRVEPIARAIEPILEPTLIDRLRGHFLRFVDEGGRTNLQRWALAVDATAARAGLLLCNDLAAAERVLRLEHDDALNERMDDLIVFTVSDRHAKLRRQIGVALA